MSGKWTTLQAEFLKAHEKTGITAKEWCEQRQLNYSTARRYIKPLSTNAHKLSTSPVAKAKQVTVANRKQNNRFGIQNNLLHGGYSKYFKDPELNQLVEATTLEDELSLCRSRIHLIIKTIEQIQAQLDNKPSTEIASSLFESLFQAETALDKNIARVESITKTLSSIEIDQLNQKKIIADTKKSIVMSKSIVSNRLKSEVQTELARIQVKVAEREAGGTNKLDDLIDEMAAANTTDVVVKP
ncbi:hypothetical protein [Shewanella surugensis]|uniref:Terminase n=1 Tax=Shewanella surugensis TaxID=212020 RepID=A0ABT0L6V5_9GAMM|nr:hypothetical protein [Shewanella surugensis]MCL1123401.1 hypothetical protein [Shewanella surugensis]